METAVEEGESKCLDCKCKHTDKGAEFTSAKRMVAILTATSCVLCVLTISACCCSLYLYTCLQGFRQELVQLVKSQALNSDADDSFGNHFPLDHDALPMYGVQEYSSENEQSEKTQFRRHVERNNRIRKNKKKTEGKNRDNRNERCKKKQKKICDCCKKEVTEYFSGKMAEIQTSKDEHLGNLNKSSLATTQPSQHTPSTDLHHNTQKKFSYVTAAHYSTFVDVDYIREKFGKLEHDMDKHPPVLEMPIPEWQGTLYRNRQFETTVSPQTLKIFQEVEWMKDLTEKLFDFDNRTGKFRVLRDGLYHLYAHVLFYDVKAKMAIGLSHHTTHGLASESKGKERMVFRCMESVDHVDPKRTVGENSKYKSCSVNGVLYLYAGDEIEMQCLYSNTRLDLSKDATYFGAILFATPTMK